MTHAYAPAAGLPPMGGEDQGTEVVTLATVTPERTRWLWPGRLPAGKLVVLDGDPSVGKSTLTLDYAARVSNGSAWPDGAPSAGSGDVLLLSAEDGLADTIAPRLHAAGADLSRVHALTEVTIRDEAGDVHRVPPSLPRDVGTVEQVVRRHHVRLVVVDVLMAYLSSRIDSHRDQDVRGVLHLMSAVAERTGATVLMVRHLNKASGQNALYRGGGSIGIVGAARAAYLVARDPDDEHRRIFAVTKLNLAAEPPALAYRLVDDPMHGCARIEWEDAPTEHTAAELLRATGDDDVTRTERDEAADWLRAYLIDNGGEAQRTDVLKAARAQEFSEATLKRARERAGVSVDRRGFPSSSVWVLEVPVGSQSAQLAQGFEGEPTDPTVSQLDGADGAHDRHLALLPAGQGATR